MVLLFLLLFITSSSLAADLIDSWECGADTQPWTKSLSYDMANQCHPSVKRSANLCCKTHDQCYDTHSFTGLPQKYCDWRFCECLQDASDKAKEHNCDSLLLAFCSAVQTIPGIFEGSSPADHTFEFESFEDTRPLGLDMRALLDSCETSKRIVVHCHNSAAICLQSDHERDRRAIEKRSIVEHSYEDCRSTMYECLEKLLDSYDNKVCHEMARTYARDVNTYAALNHDVHGHSIMEAYPVIAARLIKKCERSIDALKSCFLIFHKCSVSNGKKDPLFHSYARRSSIRCHKTLSKCIQWATQHETSEACVEAQFLARNRIRDKEVEEVKSTFYDPSHLTNIASSYFRSLG